MTDTLEEAPKTPGRGASALGPLGRAIVRQISGAALTLVAASFVIFTALQFTPGDPVSRLVGDRASAQQREAARQSLGLDQPLLVRYWEWLSGFVRGDFGTSISYRQDVSSLVGPRIATTLTLVVLAGLMIVIIGVLVGSFAGTNDRWRPLVSAFIGVGIAVPAFVSSSLLIGIFAVKLGWFPTFGAGSGFFGRLHHLLLPAIALSLGYMAYIAQMTTAAVREQAGKEHVMTATGRGINRRDVFRRHVLRNSSLPVLTASGLTVAGLVAGSIVVESAFAVDGMGSFLVRSVQGKDYPVVLTISMLIVAVFVIVTALLDISQGLLDPRSRKAGADR